MSQKKEKTPSIFQQEVKRDLNTFKRLKGTKRIRFVWDYFRFKIVVAIFAVIFLISAGIALYQGQKPCRIRVCVVLNDEISCQKWFDEFFKELKKDGNTAKCELNEDQPFDYDNKYYYVQELEVMSTVSSQGMDVAICGPDMYDYLLALNACLPLDTVLSEASITNLKDSGMLTIATANTQYKEDGTLDTENAIDGYFAIELTGTAFAREYNDGQEDPLYAIIIRNTDHTQDALKFLETITQ